MIYTEFASRPRRVLLSTVALLGLFVVTPVSAEKGSGGGKGGGGGDAQEQGRKGAVPADSPEYFDSTYTAAMKVPTLKGAKDTSTTSSTSSAITSSVPSLPSVVPNLETDSDSLGSTGSFQPNGATTTATNAFFQSLGTNGRSCFTCHQMSSGMAVSASNIAARAAVSQADPVFAPVDGSNCPGAVLKGDPFTLAHSLLLTKGLFRVFMPVPLQTSDVKPDGSANPHPVEYTIKVLHDPNGCNTDPTYSQVVDSNGRTRQIISIYRRSTMAGNLNFVTTTTASVAGVPASDPVTGQPLATDPSTGGFTSGHVLSGNIMWDGREPTLESQAKDATLGHAQATQPPTPDQVKQIVAFETGIWTAQLTSNTGSAPVQLSVGSNGGPAFAAGVVPGTVGPAAFNLFDGWQSNTGSSPADNLRASILRGQQIFNTRTFTISNVAGHNNATGASNSGQGTCASCHNQVNAGSSRLEHNQMDIGVGGTSGNSHVNAATSPSADLPIFQITCKPGFTTPFNGTTITTNDPGLALITGRCADVGRFTVPTLRALAARAPYFHDGSAQTLSDVFHFYESRFGLHLSGGERDDLVNFLAAL